MITVKVFVIMGDQGGEALVAEMVRMPECRAEVYTCPKSIEHIQPMPFIQVDNGERFYGKEGIEAFLAERAAAK